MQRNRHGYLFIGLCLWLASHGQVLASALQQESVTTTPAYLDGVLYIATTDTSSQRGHLRAIDILDTLPSLLWNAAEHVPPAGTSRSQPQNVQPDNAFRTLFTNLDGVLTALEGSQAERLHPLLGSASVTDAEILLHAVRGRRGGTAELVAGTTEDRQRLWGLSQSSPVLVSSSPVDPQAGQRPRVLYIGAEDGMLHAFFVSHWDDESGRYLIDDPDGGIELWAYLPGSFIPQLGSQPLDSTPGQLAIHLDGTPVVGEYFVDLDGNGQRQWRTLLVATGTILQTRRSSLFVLDVTDPYQPALLWEMPLPGSGVGRTRGVSLARCAEGTSDCLYLTADFAPQTGSVGLHAIAVSLTTGQLLWQFSTSYTATGTIAESTPAVPALMDLDGNDSYDALVFGDLVGRLWALDLNDGRAYGGAPIFITPGGAAEPIGASVATYGNVAVFGTGGVAGTSDLYQYALYAVNVLPEGGSLRWRHPLQTGEKIWATPVLDACGNVVFATATNYLPLIPTSEQVTTGRLVTIDKEGTESSSRTTDAATVGRVVASAGIIVSVDIKGEVTQFGTASRLTGPGIGSGSVRILSWRPL